MTPKATFWVLTFLAVASGAAMLLFGEQAVDAVRGNYRALILILPLMHIGLYFATLVCWFKVRHKEKEPVSTVETCVAVLTFFVWANLVLGAAANEFVKGRPHRVSWPDPQSAPNTDPQRP